MSNAKNLSQGIFLTCTAVLGGLLFGFDVAIITGAGPFLNALSAMKVGYHKPQPAHYASLLNSY